MFWRRKPKITQVGQLWDLTPQDWFVLPYEQRIGTVKLFLENEFPAEYPKYTWEVFVLVEDGTESLLRQWEREGRRVFSPLPPAMLFALMQEGSQLEAEGVDAALRRAWEIAEKKRKG